MRTAKVWILITTAALMAGCAKKSSSSPAAASTAAAVVPGYTPPDLSTTPDPSIAFTEGGTATFTFDSAGTFYDYSHNDIGNLNKLSNVQINLDLERFGTVYGGEITIRYQRGGSTYQDVFSGGHGADESKYNLWYKNSGNDIFHGFFDDGKAVTSLGGALILVIDSVTDLGDGSGASTASGSVWFKNFGSETNSTSFGYTYAPHPPSFCWFVSIGPYNCQAWALGASQDYGVNPQASVYPDANYEKLGSFTNIDLNGSFNGDLQLP